MNLVTQRSGGTSAVPKPLAAISLLNLLEAVLKNRYGVDVSYFKRELNSLSKSLPNRTPEELHRYLLRLADVVKPLETKEKIKMSNEKNISNLRIACGASSMIKMPNSYKYLELGIRDNDIEIIVRFGDEKIKQLREWFSEQSQE